VDEKLQGCRRCPRLAAYRDELKRRYPDYYCAPVPASGAADARLLIVGLAPGLHGANASGRPFTGDASGDLLFASLHRFGFASGEQARSGADEMQLHDCRLTNAVKCVPPQNRPLGDEINSCNRFLAEEITSLPAAAIVLALGGVAHRAVLKALGLRAAQYPFADGASYLLENGRRLVCAYHPSRLNQNTGRVTAESFARVLAPLPGLLQ
jgi:uracil-DNA glycosylase family 4